MNEFEPNREIALVQSSPETNPGQPAGRERRSMALPALCAIPMAVGPARGESGKALAH